MRCTIETKDFGDMVFTLYPEYAPITVANFVKVAKSGFYDGLCWCRIVKDYVEGVYMIASSNMYFKDAKIVK